MTYENLYEADLRQAKVDYKEKMLQPLAPYRYLGEIPTDIVDLLTYEKELKKKADDLGKVNIPPFTYDVSKNITKHFDELDVKSISERDSIKKKYADKKSELLEKFVRLQQLQKQALDDTINPFREKHKQLIAYKDQMQTVCTRYGITPLDMNISDDLTPDEFNALLDESLDICASYREIETDLFSKVLQPLTGETTFQFVVSYTVVIIIVLYFVLPLASIALFGYMIKQVHGLYRDLDKVKLAVALMSQIDYNRFVDDEDLLIPPEEPDLSEYDEQMAEELRAVEDHSDERSEAMQAVATISVDIREECAKVTNEVMEEYGGVKRALNDRMAEVQDKITSYMSKYEQFPTVCSNSIVMSHDYVLGRIEDRIDVRATLPLSNIVFDGSNRELALSTIKLYLCNALLSVRVKQLIVDIYDPQNQGREFAEFFTTDTQEYIKPNEVDINKLMEQFREYTQDNIKRLDHMDIDTFNKGAEEKDMMPLGYRLLIIVSELEKLGKEKDEAGRVFREFFKYSAENGVMIWIIDTKKWAGSVWVSGEYSGEKGRALQYDLVLGKKAMDTFSHTLETYKDRGISYLSNFADKYIPREKWWTWNTIEGIDLHFGLEDGDPTKGYPIQLNDGNVHMLCAGATGAGKSALISILITSMITMYPPSELTLIYIDFKNSEAAKLTKDGRSTIPHTRIISGTTDGEYALSIFDYLIKELTDRQKIAAKYKEVNLKDLRKRHPEVVIPRLLVLFDEFQVMYNPEYVPPRIIDKINSKITAFTKLARAYGGHLMFTSQSMAGTMSKDTMGNFTVRGALRCASDVSEALIGNNAASKITQKFGYMYTNTTGGEDPKFNKKWRVPFIDVPEMNKIIEELNGMLESHHEKSWNAEFYDEKELVPCSLLYQHYEKHFDSYSDPETIILGERAGYSVNRAPLNTTLAQDTKENILIGAFEREDLLNLVLTVVTCIKQHPENELIMQVADKDSHRLLGVKDLVRPEVYDISTPEQDVIEFIEAIQDMVSYREEVGGPYKPVFVVCVGWEVAPGFGADQYRGIDKFRPLFVKAPSVGVHFVFAMKSKPVEPCSFVPQACAHRIGALLPTDYLYFIDCSSVEKLPDHDADKGLFAIYKYGTAETKFRIYQHKLHGTIKSREVFIGEE